MKKVLCGCGIFLVLIVSSAYWFLWRTERLERWDRLAFALKDDFMRMKAVFQANREKKPLEPGQVTKMFEFMKRKVELATDNEDGPPLPKEYAIDSHMTFGQLLALMPELERGTRGCETYALQMAEYNKKQLEDELAPYRKVLSGDRLKVFNEVFAAGGHAFGEGGVSLKTPEDMLKARIWANVGQPKNFSGDTRWEMATYHWDGMKLIDMTTTRGKGETPPASAFTWIGANR